MWHSAKGDFRDRAVAASRSLLDHREPLNPRTVGTSLCLPVSASGARELKMAGWRKLTVHILFFLGAFGSLMAGLAGSQLKDPRGKVTPLGRDLEIFGLIGFFSFDVLFLVFALGGDRIWKPFLAHRLRGHADSLLNEAEGLRSRVLRVEDARTYHRQKVAGEDLAIALLDPENRRIMLEGLSHRYVIRGEDVTCFWPLQAHSVISIRIDYMIADEKLALVLATTNPWFHFFHGAFAEASVKRLVNSLSQALACEPHEETAGGPTHDGRPSAVDRISLTSRPAAGNRRGCRSRRSRRWPAGRFSWWVEREGCSDGPWTGQRTRMQTSASSPSMGTRSSFLSPPLSRS